MRTHEGRLGFGLGGRAGVMNIDSERSRELTRSRFDGGSARLDNARIDNGRRAFDSGDRARRAFPDRDVCCHQRGSGVRGVGGHVPSGLGEAGLKPAH